MIKLTTEQQNRLKAASSGIYGELRNKLTSEQEETTSEKINQVLFDLHNENPEAFSTFCYKNQRSNVVFSKLKSY